MLSDATLDHSDQYRNDLLVVRLFVKIAVLKAMYLLGPLLFYFSGTFSCF